VAHNDRRNADEALVLALASGQTLRDAAQAVGIGERRKAKKTVESAQLAGEEVEAVEVEVV
jgi:hypothetical protein